MRPRRHVKRLSDAPGYDRTADRPNPEELERSADWSGDGERVVSLDDNDADPELDDAARYREERPPHYGE